jgi:hypothetical protein
MDISMQRGANPVVDFWAFWGYWFCAVGAFVGHFWHFVGFPFLDIKHLLASEQAGTTLALLQHQTRVWGASSFGP